MHKTSFNAVQTMKRNLNVLLYFNDDTNNILITSNNNILKIKLSKNNLPQAIRLPRKKREQIIRKIIVKKSVSILTCGC